MKIISRLKESIKEDIKDYKEADDFVKSEYETEEEKKEDKIVRISLLILGVILVALFGVIIFAIKAPLTTIYKTYTNLDNGKNYYPNGNYNNDNSNNTNSDNEYINGNVNTQTYKKFKIGDSVTLGDNSKWYVIEDSKEDEAYVVLLATTNINDGTLTPQNAEEYLDNKYKASLAKTLKVDAQELIIRLISLNDLSILSGISEEQLDVNSVIQNDKTPKFIYETINLTNHTDDNDKPVYICPNNNKAILCTGDYTAKNLIIKPVLEISKDKVERR